MEREKLKLIVKNLKLLVESLESEVYSDVDAYKYEGTIPITDYDEVFDDDGVITVRKTFDFVMVYNQLLLDKNNLIHYFEDISNRRIRFYRIIRN